MENKNLFKTGVKKKDSFLSGFFAIIKSFKVISEHRGIKKFFVIPFILNIVILSSILFFSYYFLKPWLMDFFIGDAWYLSVIRFLVKPVLIGLLFFLTIVFYSILGNIITSPFNDFLSLKVEEVLTGADFNEKFSVNAFVSDIVRVASNLIKMLFFVLIINILLLVLNMVPVAGNILYSILSFLVTSFFLGFQFFDFPLERRRYVFRDKLKIALSFKMQTAGLGAAFFLLSFIPVAGFMGLNLATIGATQLYIDNMKPVLIRE